MSFDDSDLLDKRELEHLRQAIAALRAQIDHGLLHGKRERRGSVPAVGSAIASATRSAREGIDQLDPLALLSALRERLSLFSMESHAHDVDELGFEPEAVRSARPLLDFLFERWWRVEVTGIERIPASERLLFVANRSGILPYDGLMIGHALARELGPAHRARFMVADWLVSLPFVQAQLARLGGVRACAENAERLLRAGHPVVAFPEGQKGAVKLFHDRYRLQRFARGGFISIALRERAVIVPVGVVGAEETHPVLYHSGFASRVLGLPALVTATFPLLGPLGLLPLPSRWRISFGKPVSFADEDPAVADDPLYVNRATEQVRASVQKLVDREVRRRPSVFL